MSFLKNLAALAISKQVTDTLRRNCPADLSAALEQLLSDQDAVAAIRNFIAAQLKTPDNITRDALLGLALPDSARRLLSDSPALLDYLVDTARAKIRG
ncbi:MAG TPA: hypothetical protein H9976_08070 [Candidatus Akkermansia intestinavium]|nr:hypothetical protein [Candidatus Akkermansia intestinavium]